MSWGTPGRRQLMAFAAILVFALSGFSPTLPGSPLDAKAPGLPAIHAGGSPHLGLVAQDRGKQQLLGAHVAVVVELIGTSPNSSATGVLSALRPVIFGTAPVSVDGSRAPPQLLLFA